jgi:hypothetical protein
VRGASELSSLSNQILNRWKWLARLKQSDGGFTVCVEGEEDVR